MNKLSKKLLKTLRMVRNWTDEYSGMYPGVSWKLAPAQLYKLEKRGYVEHFYPHNPIHDNRAIITDAGRAALKGAAE